MVSNRKVKVTENLNNFAASSAEIGESLQRSAAALSGASNSLSESIGLITSAQTIVQNAETVGTSLKTISARIRGTTSDLGDDADDLVTTTSKLRKEIKALSGVDVLDGNNFKSTYQILKEIAEVYDTLDGSAQGRIAELLGGKVGINTIQAILGNFDTAKQIVEELDTGLAKGSAAKELEKSLDSVQGKLNQLKSTWQQFSNDFLGTGLIKGAVDLLKGLVSTLDKLTKSAKGFGLAITAAFATLMTNRNVRKSGYGNILGFTGFENGLRNGKFGFMTGIQPESLLDVTQVRSQINQAMGAKKNGQLDSLTNINAGLREYIKNTDAANVSVAGFYASQTKSAQGFLGSIQAIKTYNSISQNNVVKRKEFANAIAISNEELGKQMQQLKGANATAVTYFKTIKIGVKEFAGKAANMFLSGLTSLAISAAIGGIVYLFQWLSKSYDRMIEKNAELTKSFKETTDSLKESSDNINSLMSQYSNIIITTSDLSTAQSQLIDIQNELAESLGIEKDQLDLVNDSYADNIKLILERRKKLAKEFTDNDDNEYNYKQAQNQLEERSVARWERLATGSRELVKKGNYSAIKASGYGDWDDDIKVNNIMSKFKNISLSSQQNTLYVDGTVDEQLETLKALNAELIDLWGNLPSDANQHQWLKDIQERIDTLEELKTNAEKMITTYEELQAVLGSNISDETYSKISEAEEIVKQLQSADNAKEIIEASNAYRQLKDEIYNSVDSKDTVALAAFNSFFDNVEKNVDKRILDINNQVTALEKVYKQFQDETYDKFTGKLSKLDSAIKTITAGDYMDEASMNELIKMDALTLEDFEKTAEGYTVSLDNLLNIRKKLIDEQKDDIADNLDEEKKLYADQLAQIEQLEKEFKETNDSATEHQLNALKKQAEETNKRIKSYQAWSQMISENISDLQNEIYEKVSSKVGKIDSAIKTLSAGEYIDAATLVELVKVDSSLLDQFDQSIEGYTLSIDTLYKVRKNLIEKQKNDIKQEIEFNKKQLEEQEKLIELYRKGYDSKGYRIDENTRTSALKSYEDEKKEMEERLKYWELYLKLINQGTDSLSMFQQAMSDIKGFKDDLSSLYSEDGLDDQFFIDHPQLLKYKNDINALSEEIQKLATAKASPVIEQLRDEMTKAMIEGDFESVQKLNSAIEQLEQATDLSNLRILEKQKKKIREQVEEKERYIKQLERQKDKEQKILDKLNKQKEALEKQEEKYQTASKTAQDYIDSMIDSLDKETDALEENKKAIEDDFDARIQAINDAIDAIDKEAEAIEKEADEQERLNDLKEKELALEKARNEKVRVYSASRGWVRNRTPFYNIIKQIICP